MAERVDQSDDIHQQMRRAYLNACILPVTNDHSVIEAFSLTDRLHFVPDGQLHMAYSNVPVPLNEDGSATISQPEIIAVMLTGAQLSGSDNVLEVGTGSGYTAAVLSRCSSRVTTIERDRTLAETATATLARHGYDRVRVVVGDGVAGWAEEAPYDVIIVTGGARGIPTALFDQLSENGRIIIPIEMDAEKVYGMDLIKGVKRNGKLHVQAILSSVAFVPLVSELQAGLRTEGEGGGRDKKVLSPEEFIAHYDNQIMGVAGQIADFVSASVIDPKDAKARDFIVDRTLAIIKSRLDALKSSNSEAVLDHPE